MLDFLSCEPDHEDRHSIDMRKGLDRRQESPSIGPEIIAEDEKSWERLRYFPPPWTVETLSVSVRHVFVATFKIAVVAMITLVVLFI